jgi:ParB family chromosome partitioning protein
MTSIITAPLNKLIADPKNVRKSYGGNGIQELAASIRAVARASRNGLLPVRV